MQLRHRERFNSGSSLPSDILPTDRNHDEALSDFSLSLRLSLPQRHISHTKCSGLLRRFYVLCFLRLCVATLRSTPFKAISFVNTTKPLTPLIAPATTLPPKRSSK